MTTPAIDPARDDAQDKALDALTTRVDALARESTEHRDHRTRAETRWSLIAAVVGALGVGALVGAVTTRDAVQATSLRVAALERAQTDAATSARERDADDRRTTEALVRLTVTVESLRAQVADLTSELRARESSAPRPAGR